jgi:hypothetical protein
VTEAVPLPRELAVLKFFLEETTRYKIVQESVSKILKKVLIGK